MPDNIPGGLNFSLLEKMPLTVAISEKIIGAIQKAMYKNAAFNSWKPMHPAKRAVKENGQLMVTEIRYGTRFMNSYLDITYPTADTTVKRPTVFYTHGGGFFGGSKTMGDPMAAGDDSNFLFEDIVKAGFNFVNVDYVLTPEGHFPDQLMQLTEAIDFCAEHAEEYRQRCAGGDLLGGRAGAGRLWQRRPLLHRTNGRRHTPFVPWARSGGTAGHTARSMEMHLANDRRICARNAHAGCCLTLLPLQQHDATKEWRAI